MIAETAVHTTGVNWESIGVIITGVSVLLTVTGWIFQRFVSSIREEIHTSVKSLSDKLTAQLETKETVAKISERLARMEERDRIRDEEMRREHHGESHDAAQ